MSERKVKGRLYIRVPITTPPPLSDVKMTLLSSCEKTINSKQTNGEKEKKKEKAMTRRWTTLRYFFSVKGFSEENYHEKAPFR